MRAHPLRVLLVDDDPTLVMIDTRLLQHLGYHITAFSSSREALAAFAAQPGEFDLVITDQAMPEMTGIALAEALRELRPDMPILLVTGSLDERASDSAARLGFGEVLLKPLSTQVLAEAAERVLAKRA
jgi:CheY-like chemotaxis protein